MRDFDAFKELDQSHLKTARKYEKRFERGVLGTTFDVADVGAAQAAMLRQVILVPASGLTQVSDALSKPKIDVFSCHLSSMNVFYWLHFANWLHSRRKENLKSSRTPMSPRSTAFFMARTPASPTVFDGFANRKWTSDDPVAGFLSLPIHLLF